MPKLCPLTSNELTQILIELGFHKNSQKGSYIKFLRFKNNKKEILIIPNHKQLAIGTTKEIFNQLCNFVPRESIYHLFYK